MKKKGIELSINLLVILIISIVIFSFGVFFVTRMFKLTTEKHNEITDMTKKQIESMLDSGGKIAIPVTTLKIRRGDTGTFGMGVLNVDTSNNKFYIKIEAGNAYDENGDDMSDNDFVLDPNLITIRGVNPYVIGTNKKEVYSVVVNVPSTALPGTHILNIYVCHDNDPTSTGSPECTQFSGFSGTELYDDSIHQIYVEVS